MLLFVRFDLLRVDDSTQCNLLHFAACKTSSTFALQLCIECSVKDTEGRKGDDAYAISSIMAFDMPKLYKI